MAVRQSNPNSKAISIQRHSPLLSWNGLATALFGLAFIAIGGTGLWLAAIFPVIQVFRSQDWVEVPCTIASSRIVHGSRGTSAIRIEYGFEFDGRQWQGHRYDFTTGYSSGTRSKQRVLAQYPAGGRALCFVNPANPAESIINRGFRPDMLWGLPGLLFLIIGIGVWWGMIGMVRSPVTDKARGQDKGNIDSAPETWGSVAAGDTVGLRGLQSDSTRQTEEFPLPNLKPNPSDYFEDLWFRGLILSIFVVLAVWQGLDMRVNGLWDACLLVLIIGGGIWFVAPAGRAILLMRNPPPLVKLNRADVTLGETATMMWDFDRDVRAIRRLTLSLEGQEWAYSENEERRGGGWKSHCFYREQLFETADPQRIATGRVQFGIPSDTMHTVQGSSNLILWTLTIRGANGWWSGVVGEYPFEVAPRR